MPPSPMATLNPARAGTCTNRCSLDLRTLAHRLTRKCRSVRSWLCQEQFQELLQELSQERCQLCLRCFQGAQWALDPQLVPFVDG
jgi:hypothetical protein